MKLKMEKIGITPVSASAGRRGPSKKRVSDGAVLYPISGQKDDIDLIKDFLDVIHFPCWRPIPVILSVHGLGRVQCVHIGWGKGEFEAKRFPDTPDKAPPDILRMIPQLSFDSSQNNSYVDFDLRPNGGGIFIELGGFRPDEEAKVTAQLIDLGFEVVEEAQ